MKYNVGIVNYLNTRPLLTGLQQTEILNKIIVHELNPAACADWMAQKKVDIALVPVAFLHENPDLHLFSRFGIGCDGPVRTVCLVANQPIDLINKIYLDNHSRTSVRLLQILLKKYWHKEIVQQSVEIADCQPGPSEAMLVIGDKAFELVEQYSFIYDLGEIWKRFTGMPFLFACWVSRDILPIEFVNEFDDAQASGILQTDAICEQLKSEYPDLDLKNYFNNNIIYDVTPSVKQALGLFLSKFSTPAITQ